MKRIRIHTKWLPLNVDGCFSYWLGWETDGCITLQCRPSGWLRDELGWRALQTSTDEWRRLSQRFPADSDSDSDSSRVESSRLLIELLHNFLLSRLSKLASPNSSRGSVGHGFCRCRCTCSCEPLVRSRPTDRPTGWLAD